MRLLVTGASGFIGMRVCSAAVRAGHDVRAFIRPASRRSLPEGCVVYGQLPYDVPAMALDAIDAVIHCAGATTGQDMAESRAINVEGTRYLLKRANKANPDARFIFLSSQSAHEGAVSAYGKTKLEAEQAVKSSGLPYAILRPGLVYGPGEQGLFYRMRKSISKLPFIPLLGGGKALVQAVEVSDLADAILRCLELPRGESVELNLGDPEGVPLREFLQQIAIAETGKRKPQAVIPTAPLKLAVRTANVAHVPFPISMDNIRGMETVQRMVTAPSLEKLRMQLKPLAVGMAEAVRPAERPASSGSVIRVVLVGAGKIGIVHALNLRHRSAFQLAAIVDKSPKAYRLYKSIGFDVPYRQDLTSAIRDFSPQAAIVATPASTHYEVAKECLDAGLHVLVEKPMASQSQMIAEFSKLASRFPDRVFHVGYMAAQYPHLGKARELLKNGAIGAVQSFHASALQTHIMASKPLRWEMIKAQSGGGALINFGSHVLSMLVRLFGEPESMRVGMWSIYSPDVEDVLEAEFGFAGGLRGRFLATWSIAGYSRPDNRIIVHGETGNLVLDNHSLSVRHGGRTTELHTQLDFDIGYNAAPDYTGGGFSCEHLNFAAAIRGEAADAVTQGEAARLEALIFECYKAAGSVPLEVSGDSADDARFNELIARLRR